MKCPKPGMAWRKLTGTQAAFSIREILPNRVWQIEYGAAGPNNGLILKRDDGKLLLMQSPPVEFFFCC